MKAVANSSVLIALAVIDQLALLAERFVDGILVPEAVWREVVETGKGQPGSEAIASASWISRHGVKDKHLVSLLRMELDEGEAEAITLCLDERVEVVLLDEKDARYAAQRLGLKILGAVGILIWAKRAGLIASLREQLDALRNRAKFRLSQLVYEEALRAVGEI